ncbi:MAG: hypothetical protein EOO89_23120 [Pedobacter sp.]|nr:MAG: hypothetical protein EOO89_23120 [Pedobacter sp.]
MRSIFTVGMLIISNVFMTLAWYGHLKFKDMEWSRNMGLISIILLSWIIALAEYAFQVPANKFGFRENGGPFTLLQLKVIQEALSITIFLIFSFIFFKTERIAWNHFVGFGLIILAIFFIFKKW